MDKGYYLNLYGSAISVLTKSQSTIKMDKGYYIVGMCMLFTALSRNPQ